MFTEIGFKRGDVFFNRATFSIQGGLSLSGGTKYKSPGTGEFKINLIMRDSSVQGMSPTYYVKKNEEIIFSQSHPSDGKVYNETIYVNVSFGDEIILTADGYGRVSALFFEGLFYIDKPNTILSLLSKWEDF